MSDQMIFKHSPGPSTANETGNKTGHDVDHKLGGKLTGLLLAAGQASRMQGPQKLLLKIAGEPMVRHVAEAMAKANFAECVAIVGREGEQVAEALAGLGFQICFNRDFAQGLLTSLQAGVRASSMESQGYVVALGDQPDLQTEHFNQMIQAFSGDPENLITANYSGQRGHPVLIGRSYRDELLQRNQDLGQGAKFLFQRYANRVHEAKFAEDFKCRDIDTPEDYQNHFSSSAKNAMAQSIEVL